MAFSHALGFVMSRILLTIFWLTVIAAYALVLKAVVLVRPGRAPASYWRDAEPQQDIRFQF